MIQRVDRDRFALVKNVRKILLSIEKLKSNKSLFENPEWQNVKSSQMDEHFRKMQLFFDTILAGVAYSTEYPKIVEAFLRNHIFLIMLKEDPTSCQTYRTLCGEFQPKSLKNFLKL